MIPVRYAKALFEFAAEKGCDERVYGQMGKLAAAFVREPELRRALDNPVLPESEKLKLVYAAWRRRSGRGARAFRATGAA